MPQDQDIERQEQAAPEITVDYQGNCPSITGRSTLTFEVGRLFLGEHAVPHMRIASNSGGGMFCKDWAPIAHVDAILAKADPVTARTFNEVHPGKSINTGGFYLAILKDLGVVQPKDDNTRHHERVPGTTVLAALTKQIEQSGVPEVAAKTRRKGKSE